MKGSVTGWMALLLAASLASCAHSDEASRPRRAVRPHLSEDASAAGPPVVEAPPPVEALLAPGAKAPDVAAPDQDDKLVRLKDRRGRTVVLYFFVQDFHPVCTLEARKFQHDYDKLKALGADVIGVSADKSSMQKEFADKESITFPLLSDPDDKIARAFGVPVHDTEEARRVTFLIDRDGVIKSVYPHVKAVLHAAEVLAAVEDLSKAESAAETAKKAADEAAAKKKADEDAAKKKADEAAAKKAAAEEAKAAKKKAAEDAKAAKKKAAEDAKAAREAKKKGKAAPAAEDAKAKAAEGDKGGAAEAGAKGDEKPAKDDEVAAPEDKPEKAGDKAGDKKPDAKGKATPAADKPAADKPAAKTDEKAKAQGDSKSDKKNAKKKSDEDE